MLMRGSKVSTDHNGAFMTPHTLTSVCLGASSSLLFLFFPLPPALLSSYVALLLSLPPSVPAGQYSALPLFKRLLFKTLRSDLVPTEAIPLAALCIYHGSPTLSRLLPPQFSCLLPPFFHFLFSLCISQSHTHTLIYPVSNFTLFLPCPVYLILRPT
ncbi:hypothetical protein ILYODFUR_004124 [Ilyodon furcidens]|uniref:Uncharacterized protein n=1 Tax=Ilyodon furcidens TaxID=33524 RepID=A0ABV0VCH8_9TELE